MNKKEKYRPTLKLVKDLSNKQELESLNGFEVNRLHRTFMHGTQEIGNADGLRCVTVVVLVLCEVTSLKLHSL